MPRILAGGAAAGSAVPGISRPAAEERTLKPSDSEKEFDAERAERQRFEKVRAAAEVIADVYVLGDQRLNTFYKDATGQYITRFTSLRDGKVTYIPEPQLLNMQRATEAAGQALRLEA